MARRVQPAGPVIVELEIERLTTRGYRYGVIWNGERIVTDSADPEHDACRALLARGITGRMETRTDGKTRMLFDIEYGAGRMTTESDKGGLHTGKYRAPPWEAKRASNDNKPARKVAA